MKRIRVGALLAKSAREAGMKPTGVASLVDKSEASARQWMACKAEISGRDVIVLMAKMPGFFARVMEVVEDLRKAAA
jgi:hypothetical protein